MREKYYYSFKEKDVVKYNFRLEDYLSKKECEFSLVLKKIITGIEGYYYNKSSDVYRLSHMEKRTLLEFIYFQILRVPKYINNLFENGKDFLAGLNRKYNYTQTASEMIDDIKSIMFPILFENAEEFISIVQKRNWAFLVIEKNINEHFVSSDNPILITNDTKDVKMAGIVDPMTEISVPISNKIILTIRETYIINKVEYFLVNSIETIDKINLLIKNNALRFIYSNDISKLENN
jgi:hypothetical protein